MIINKKTGAKQNEAAWRKGKGAEMVPLKDKEGR
jgi:hypothetical protein